MVVRLPGHPSKVEATKIVVVLAGICIACLTPVWYSDKEMKKAADRTTTSTSGGESPFIAGTIGMTFLDTTWRISVPVILFTVLGIVADRSFGTKPWLTLLAVVVGFVAAGWLVKNQLDAVEREERRKK